MNQNKLLSFMICTLIEHGIEINLYSDSEIASSSGGTISGSFCEEEKKIEVACSEDGWFMVFVHEYCHFQQWLEGLFDDAVVIAAYSVFDTWLDGTRELPQELLLTFIRKMQWLELDNEKRTIKLLEEFDVAFNKEEYIKEVNVDILSYEYCRRIRKWHTSSLNTDKMSSLMSNKLLSEREFGTLPDGFEEIAIRCYDFTEE